MSFPDDTERPPAATPTPAEQPAPAEPEPAVAAETIAEATETVVPAVPEPEPAPAPERKGLDGDRSRGIGRRKTAVARVIIKPGTGKMSVNRRELAEYFRRRKLVDEVTQPFVATGTVNKFDTVAVVSGSSLASQAGAVRLGIARALAGWQPDFRSALSSEGLLTRDPRMVERKKYGIRGARRRPQWTKR